MPIQNLSADDNRRFKLLVVDDEEVIRTFLNYHLQKEYTVQTACDGADAIEKVKEFKPDLFIIDSSMPKMSGPELVTQLRQIKEFNTIPIIMLTAKDNIKDKVEGFACGVDDYVTKPFNWIELMARINVFLKKSQKTKYVNTFMNSFGNMMNENDLTQFTDDLKVASRIQLNLMPNVFPEHPNFDFGAKMIPAKQVGGDFYDFIQLDNSRIAICIGDISGKGISAALLMVMVRTLIRTLLSEKFSVVKVCNKINSMILRDVGMGKFVTMFLGILNLDTKRFESYVNAGHLPPFILKKDMSLQTLDSTGPFLGAFPDIEIADANYDFADGDLLLLYTDGVTEAKKDENDFFGEENLIEILKKNYSLKAPEIISEIIRNLSTFAESQSDDITIVAVKNTDTKK
mgnify:CR=1 FL=1